MKEGVTRATALRAGEVDFVNYVPKEMMERLSKDPKIQVLKGPDTQSVNINREYVTRRREPARQG